MIEWIQHNRKKAFCLYLLFAVGFVLVSLEVLLRFYVSYNPAYYSGFQAESTKGTVIRYPYGDIRINQDGYPDDEFSAEKKTRRIGYFGDSVCYGVGAGYGYRITEVLEKKFSHIEQMNFGAVANGIQQRDIPKVVKLAEEYELDGVVYLFNLNDLLPDQKRGSKTKLRYAGYKKYLDWFRGRSYLYTTARLAVKNVLVRKGYEAHGDKAFELYPKEYGAVLQATAKRVRRLQALLAENGVPLVVIVLPYEMQISSEAEERYHDLGIRWEEGFVEGSTQKKLLGLLADVPVVDARGAFLEGSDSRKSNRLGEYFVYNRGDKIDWNHPNRAGHRRIAEFLASHPVFLGALAVLEAGG